jgi:hypothetical protein
LRAVGDEIRLTVTVDVPLGEPVDAVNAAFGGVINDVVLPKVR